MKFLMDVVRAFFRLAALLFLGAGLTALVFLVGLFMADDGRIGQPLGQVWYQGDPFAGLVGTASLPLFGAIIERRLHPSIWNPGITTMLAWPSWAALSAIAAALLAVASVIFTLTRRRRSRAPAPV